MSSLKVHRFADEPVFRLSDREWTPTPDMEDQVAEIWRVATADPNRHLVDGEILCVTRFGERIEARPLRYRYFLAQTVRPEIFSDPLVALAISGILLCEDRLVLGCRADWLLQDPGTLELVPSGSVDSDLVSGGQIDVRAQLEREAMEELGIGEGELTSHRLLGGIEDGENRVIDIVIQANLTCSFEELLEAHSRVSRREYSGLQAVTPQELRRMISDGSARISAVSCAISANFCAALE